MPTFPLLIKPAGCDCNFRCDYCFYLPKKAIFGNGPHRMADSTLEALVKNIAHIPMTDYTFYWQGGEPTLMGVDFYRKAVELQKKLLPKDVPVFNCIQTNGSVLTPEWRAFLKRNRFAVGVSIDGIPAIHDKHRATAFGKPSWERVAQNVKAMIAAKIPVNALAVVTHDLASAPDRAYDTLRSLGITDFHFIPCADLDADGMPRPYALQTKDWFDFLSGIFQRWFDDPARDSIHIRYFDSILDVLAGRPPRLCDMAATCQQYLVVEHNGDVYPCDFNVLPELRLGNVATDRLDTLATSPDMAAFGARKMTPLPPTCATCNFSALCHNGCPRSRGADGRSSLCEDIRHFLAYYGHYFESLL